MGSSSALEKTVNLMVVLYGVYGVLKFAFFALPYRVRRKALDKSYGNKTTATRFGDTALLALVMVLSVLLFVRGIEPLSFLGGLTIGATIIQLFFHRFHTPLRNDREPSEPISPIKVISYAIQDSPIRAWREMTFYAVLVACAVMLMMRR